MKPQWTRTAAMMAAGAGVWLAAAAWARAEVAFTGYVRAGAETRFVLTDEATGKRSELIPLGGRFAGVTVTAFDAGAEALTVRDDTGTRVLAMQHGAVAPLPETERPAAARADDARRSEATRMEALIARRKERGRAEMSDAEIARRLKERAAKNPEALAPRREAKAARAGAPETATPGDGAAATTTAPDRAELGRQLRQMQARMEKLRAAPDRPKQEAKTSQLETEIAALERKLEGAEK